MGPFERSIWVFVGAGLGGVSRYWVGAWASGRFGPGFPWGTLVVNVLGSLAIGLVLGVLLHNTADVQWRLLLAVGFLGGFTTFSAFAYETLMLAQERSNSFALANILLSVGGSLVFCALGLTLAKAFTRS